ncbi:MAG: hypothetical protein RR483_00535 [Clostridia bacterium]
MENKNDEKQFHEKYLQWKKDYKRGKSSYYISNVLIPSLITTAVFSVALAILNIVMKYNFDAIKVLIFSVGFFLIYGVVAYGIYFYLWKNSEKKYKEYENQLNKKLLDKINNGEIEDKDGLREKLEKLIIKDDTTVENTKYQEISEDDNSL